jgi:hypothetical protein
MRTAGQHGVLDQVLADLARNDLDGTAGVVSAATKAHRFVDEMHEIAATQADAGLTPALFEASPRSTPRSRALNSRPATPNRRTFGWARRRSSGGCPAEPDDFPAPGITLSGSGAA